MCVVHRFLELRSYLLDEGQQRLLVVLPLERKFTFMGKLVAAQEDGQLEAVGVQVAEVVHTCRGSPQVRKRFTALLGCQELFPDQWFLLLWFVMIDLRHILLL